MFVYDLHYFIRCIYLHFFKRFIISTNVYKNHLKKYVDKNEKLSRLMMVDNISDGDQDIKDNEKN